MAYKIKREDDYRNKRISSSSRFQDKIHEKTSKRIDSKLDFNEVKDDKKIIPHSIADYQTEVQENRIYDPLARDLDNDGVIDRYDSDFRDSNISYESLENDKSKLRSKNKTLKRKNYSDKQFTRSDKNDTDKAISDKGKKKLLYKEHHKESLLDKGVDVSTSVGNVTSDYLASDSDDNVGIQSAEKSLRTSSKIVRQAKDYSSKRRYDNRYKNSDGDNRLQKKHSKLEFRQNLDELKKQESYKVSPSYKKFQKRKQMKSAIYKQNETRVIDRIKVAFTNTLHSSKQFIVAKSKVIIIVVISIIIFGTFILNFANVSMGSFMEFTSSTLTTTYLSSPDVLKEINQTFSSKENDLYNEIENVESNYPGYDEYIVRKNGDIGHNVHELLSYITSRCGEVKSVSEVSLLLDELFNTMYRLEYKEEIEIRYKTIEETKVDENGNEYIESHEEPYEYKKLIVTLHKKEMDNIIREIFATHPDNLSHYETLFLTQGNMGELFGNTDLIESNGGIGGGQEYEASADVQKKIVDAAFITPSPGPGWCAMWVSQVYQNAGLGYIGGNANDMYRNHTFTSDRSKLEVGMLVAVESSSSGGQAGLIYGHVGIYIGDGKVIDNIGHIRVTTLDNWISTFCKHSPVGFGFPTSVQK